LRTLVTLWIEIVLIESLHNLVSGADGSHGLVEAAKKSNATEALDKEIISY